MMALATFLGNAGDLDPLGYLLLILLLYFAPTLAATGKPQYKSVLAINFFLGWTLVGWVIALAWAVKQDSAPQVIVNQALPNPVLCANCGKYSEGGSRFCAQCGTTLSSTASKPNALRKLWDEL